MQKICKILTFPQNMHFLGENGQKYALFGPNFQNMQICRVKICMKSKFQICTLYPKSAYNMHWLATLRTMFYYSMLKMICPKQRMSSFREHVFQRHKNLAIVTSDLHKRTLLFHRFNVYMKRVETIDSSEMVLGGYKFPAFPMNGYLLKLITLPFAHHIVADLDSNPR